jgi:hypothetical protein
MQTLSTIANRANTIGKVRPADRWNAFQRLAETIDLGDREKLDALASLYSTFAPKATRRKVTSAFDWLTLAINTKDHRHYLHNVHIEDGIGYATDGHRLHSAPLPDMADGFYDISGVAVENGGKFPNVHQLIDSVMPSRFHPLTDNLGDVVAGLTERGKPAEYQALNLDDHTAHVNRGYLLDALRLCDGDGAQFGQETLKQGVMLQLSGDRMAIVMPVNMPQVNG